MASYRLLAHESFITQYVAFKAARPEAAATVAWLKRGAQARGWTMARYITALVELHDAMRALADTETPDGRWEQVRTELEALGLETRRA